MVFVLDTTAAQPRVLLIDKKTGHGAGKVNAPGGKLEPDESPLQCAQREVYEEVGLRVAELRLAAELKFVDTHAPQWFGYVFVAHEFAGVAKETREAKPFWCDLDAVPYARMWEDDRFWLCRSFCLRPQAPRWRRGKRLLGNSSLLGVSSWPIGVI